MNQRSSLYIHALVKQVRMMKTKRKGWQIYKFQTGIQQSLSTTRLLFLETQYTEGEFQNQKVTQFKYNINRFVQILHKKKDSLHIWASGKGVH